MRATLPDGVGVRDSRQCSLGFVSVHKGSGSITDAARALYMACPTTTLKGLLIRCVKSEDNPDNI